MDSVVERREKYQTIIKKLLTDYQTLAEGSYTVGVESCLALDDGRGQYLWMRTGWDETRRVRGVSIYIRLKDEKVWVEEDWTDLGVVDDLLKAGIPEGEIVLGFHPPEARQHTEFAVA